MRGQALAAEALARDLIQRDGGDAEAHRLLAHALELIAADGNAKALAEAAREHQCAERIEPGDVEGAERLAFLYAERFTDPGKALQVLDQLVQAAQGSPRKLAEARSGPVPLLPGPQPARPSSGRDRSGGPGRSCERRGPAGGGRGGHPPGRRGELRSTSARFPLPPRTTSRSSWSRD